MRFWALAAGTLLAGQLGDALTAHASPTWVGGTLVGEANPLAVVLIGMPLMAIAAKLALVTLLLATAYLLRLPGDPRWARWARIRHRVASGLLVTGAYAGLLGVATNGAILTTALIRP